MVDVLLGIKRILPREPPLLGNQIEYSYLKNYIRKLQRGQMLIVHGPPGSGKTTLTKRAIRQCKLNIVKLDSVNEKLTSQLLSHVSILPNNILLIDDVDNAQDLDNCIIKTILENTIVPIICTCRYIPKRLLKKKENVERLLITYTHQREFSKWLVDNKYPKNLIEHYTGDLNAFFHRLELWKTTGWMGGQHEVYEPIEERIKHINTVKLEDTYNVHIHEPGALCCLIQENVPHFSNITIETCNRVAEKISFADIYSVPMYNGLFGAIDIYQMLFYSSSVVELRNSKPTHDIRPGQAWTTSMSIKARMNKWNRFKARNSRNISSDHISCLNMLLTSTKQIPHSMLSGLDITPQDVDIFTKIFTVAKITTRAKNMVKQIIRQNEQG